MISPQLLDEAQIDVVEEPDPSSPSKAPRKRTRKTLPASYEPDKRADSWLKVKKDYLDNMGDSLDLVPIGAWHGSGRKAGWWSPILLG
jgi:DNA ligase-1